MNSCDCRSTESTRIGSTSPAILTAYYLYKRFPEGHLVSFNFVDGSAAVIQGKRRTAGVSSMRTCSSILPGPPTKRFEVGHP